MYKLYCHILNSRLSKWAEVNTKVADEQNGFRKGRSTIDQIMSLTNTVDTRKKLRKSTFCAFIDFILSIEIFYGNDYLNWELVGKCL